MSVEYLRVVARDLLRAYQVRSTRSRNLASAIERGVEKIWQQGELLCVEGTPSDTMFVTVEGSVQVLKKDPSGESKELAMIPAPSMIGQMGLVDGSNRSATCRASNVVKAIIIDKTTFNALLQETSAEGSAFRHLLISTMMGQLNGANSKISKLIDDMIEEATAEVPIPQSTEAQKKDRLLEIAGVLDGWEVKADGVDNVQLYEDEDMKRTREAKQKGVRKW